MESMPVNWEALDSLVIDFARSENLIQTSSPPSPPSPSSSSSSSSSSLLSTSSSSYRCRLLIRQIRHLLEMGNIDEAMDLLRLHAPAVLDDHRLLFRLQKQRFIELLRKGSPRERDSAIKCLRTALAPCALNAYPEAYEEFKHVLLAFIFDQEDQTSPVVNEWSPRRRFDLAGLISSVLRAHLQAYDPIFSMTLRYLISIHKGFCFRQGLVSPISDLTERLLLEERDSPAIPQESLYEAPPFDEVDIQALAHAVELTRQGAVDSLRYAKGDLLQAFQNELCRMKVDVPMLDELVHEYCVYRGIVDSGLASPSASDMLTSCRSSKTYQPDFEDSSLRDYSSLNMDCRIGRHSDGETSVNNAGVEDGQDVNADAVSTGDIDVELRFAGEMMHNREDCSTSGTRLAEFTTIRSQGNRSHASREGSRRKRWRRRVESRGGLMPGVSFIEDNKGEVGTPGLDANGKKSEEDWVTIKHAALGNFDNKEVHKFGIVLELRELARKGNAAEVVEEVNALDPKFFDQNPVLLFQLKQVEFLKLVKCEDHSSALRLACSYLGPLAASNPSLMKPLKETLLALLGQNHVAPAKDISLSVLATSLQVEMGKRLGIEEPQLMKILRATLYTHNEWFRLQMCKDRFEGLLKIDYLKEIDAPLFIGAASKTCADACSYGASQTTISSSRRRLADGGSPSQGSSGDIIFEETAILKVMEFLALTRSDAIQLLGQYNGNAETAIQQLFS